MNDESTNETPGETRNEWGERVNDDAARDTGINGPRCGPLKTTMERSRKEPSNEWTGPVGRMEAFSPVTPPAALH